MSFTLYPTEDPDRREVTVPALDWWTLKLERVWMPKGKGGTGWRWVEDEWGAKGQRTHRRIGSAVLEAIHERDKRVNGWG